MFTSLNRHTACQMIVSLLIFFIFYTKSCSIILFDIILLICNTTDPPYLTRIYCNDVMQIKGTRSLPRVCLSLFKPFHAINPRIQQIGAFYKDIGYSIKALMGWRIHICRALHFQASTPFADS